MFHPTQSTSVPFPVPHQVKVMLRICSTLARDTSESSSFLKVDPRKKQVTLYDPLACGGQSAFQKRGSQVPPKMFAFDAVFPQDASQVGADSPSPTPYRARQCAVRSQSCCSFTGSHALEGAPRAPEGLGPPPMEASLGSIGPSVLLSNCSYTVGRATVPGFQQDRSLKEGGANQPVGATWKRVVVERIGSFRTWRCRQLPIRTPLPPSPLGVGV